MTPDVNVLVAAWRGDHPHHGVAHHWLQMQLAATGSGARVTLMPMVVASFLRLVTSPRIFQIPSTVDAALGFVDALLAIPGVQMTTLGPEWPELRRLCIDHKLSGNALPDAWLAAATQHSGEHLVSFDRGLSKLLRRSQFTLLVPAP